MARRVTTEKAALAKTNKPVRAGDGLQNVVTGMGTTQDKRAYTTWSTPRLLSRHELENMYEGSWLAKKIVNIPADDMTREWVHFILDEANETGDAKNGPQFRIEKAEKRFQVKAKVNEALRWARLYGGSVIVIGTKDGDLSKPLQVDKVGRGALRYLHVLDRWRISPTGEVDTDLESPNFGKPSYYQVAESSVRVHHSRLLKFDGEKIPYFVWLRNGRWHDSSLQHVMDSLLNNDTVSQGIATMLFEANVDVIKHPDLAETLTQEGGDERITKRFQLAAMMKSFNRILLLDKDEEYDKKQNSFANLDKIWTNFMVDVCGAADIPMTRMFGQSPAGLQSTGEGDLRNYYDMISSKQEGDLRPQLEYLYEILVRSELGHMPEDFRFDFNPLWQMSEKDRSEVEKKRAERDKIYYDMGVLTEGAIARELHETGTYRSLGEEDVKLAEELSELGHEAAVEGHARLMEGAAGEGEGDDTPPENGGNNQVAGVAQEE